MGLTWKVSTIGMVANGNRYGRTKKGKIDPVRLELRVVEMRKDSMKGVTSRFESEPSVRFSSVITYYFQSASCSDITGNELWRGETEYCAFRDVCLSSSCLPKMRPTRNLLPVRNLFLL